MIGKILSLFYRWALWLDQASYRWFPSRTKKVGARVISIGNITWGGTGKTPLAAKLAKTLSYYGKKVAILTRGYGLDEVEELKRRVPNVPVLVGRNRAKLAAEAIRQYGAQILILDDGFQHLGLSRDVDIVTINSTEPFGPGGLIPLGTLREPVEHLARAHVFVLTKSNIGSKNLPWIHQKISSIKPGAAIFEAVHKPLRLLDPLKSRLFGLSEVRGHKIAVISALGDPHSFEKTVENLGAEILLAARFEDHHAFKASEIADFVKRARSLGIREVVTTEKDFVRLEPVLKRLRADQLDPVSFLTLQIEFRIDDEENFIRRCVNS